MMAPGYTAKTRRMARSYYLDLGGLDKRQQRRRVRRTDLRWKAHVGRLRTVGVSRAC